MRDRLVLKHLQLFGHHGVRADEREQGRFFALDAEIEFEFPKRDDLAETVDYAQVIEKIRELNEARSFRLVEAFAQAAAEMILKDFQQVRRVRLRVKKLRPPLAAGVQIAAVVAEVIRESERGPLPSP